MLKEIKKIAKKVFKRNKWSHKYDFGHVIVIGGSYLYSGSPAFNALAAYRTGSDLVTVIAPLRSANIIATFSPDLITYPIYDKFFKEKHLKEIFDFLSTIKFDSFVIGGGIGRRKETKKFVLKFLERIDKPGVIDADAIHAVSENLDIIKDRDFVLTPHTFEFFILSSIKLPTNVSQRKKLVKSFVKIIKTTLVVKGHVDIIASPEKTVELKVGSPYMTVGGTGDTLAGIIASLLGRKLSTFEAAVLGTFINGKAGEIASKKLKEGFIASDLLKEIPIIIKNLIIK